MPRTLFFSRFLSVGVCSVLLWGTGCARKNFFQPDARLNPAEALSPVADSVRNATAGRQYNRHGGLYRALVGRHYRQTWAAPVSLPVFNLAQAGPAGLRRGKVGGGFNSTSLGLSAADGQGYVLRTVDKDPARATPALLRGTFLLNALRDNVSSTQPYAALVVPPLAAAVHVPYTNPRLFYVRPDDTTFSSDSLRHFRGQLGLLEEKYSGRDAQVPELGRVRVMNSREAFAAVFASPSQRLDQRALLRARLFDAYLGDWDRHPGQWNWATPATENTPRTTYISPIPKDRDMVFYRLDDGLLGWLIGHVALRHWATFGAHFPPASSLLSSGHYLDERGLNETTRAQFKAAALTLQQQLPDTLLARAVHRLPPAAYALEGARTTAALRTRRDALPALADDFYRQLAKHVVIGGTAQAERFEIKRYADSTVVRVYASLEAGPVPYYRRTFFPAETRTLQLEGLGGNDVFDVTNAPGAARPKLTIYGGEGEDTFQPKAVGHGVRYHAGSAPAKNAYDTPPVE